MRIRIDAFAVEERSWPVAMVILCGVFRSVKAKENSVAISTILTKVPSDQ